MIYLVVYLYLLGLSLRSFYSNYYIAKGYIHVAILLIVLASLRYGTGTDFQTYLVIWSGIPNISSLFNLSNFYLEPGFVVLSSILKTIYSGDFIFFSAYACLTLGLLTYALLKLNLNIVAGLLLYFCLFYFAYAFNGMRQALSMSIFIFSLVSLKEGEKKNYYLINFIGLLFHYSSIVYLIFGFIFFWEISKQRILIYAIIFLLAGTAAYLTNVVELSIKFIFNNFFQSKLSTYFVNFKEQTTLVEFLPRLFLFGWIIFCFIRLPENKMLTALFLFYTLGFAFYISLLDFSMLNTRINMLFRVTEIVIALLLIGSVEKIHNKILVYSGFLLVYTLHLYANISIEANNYILRSSF